MGNPIDKHATIILNEAITNIEAIQVILFFTRYLPKT